MLTCTSEANPKDVTFLWKKGNETFDSSEVYPEGMTSRLFVDPIEDSFGTYYCFVNNSLGPGLPCELDLQGKDKFFLQTGA